MSSLLAEAKSSELDKLLLFRTLRLIVSHRVTFKYVVRRLLLWERREH